MSHPERKRQHPVPVPGTSQSNAEVKKKKTPQTYQRDALFLMKDLESYTHISPGVKEGTKVTFNGFFKGNPGR